MFGKKASEQDVLAALRQVHDPELHRDIVSLGMVRDLKVENGTVSLRVVLTTPACPLNEQIRADVTRALEALPGVERVDLTMDAEVRATAPRGGPRPVEGVRNIIAVASNKGGVGKSTVAVNLAVALAKRGARVGLLDADITGPNIPTMMGFRPGFMAEERQGLGVTERFGVKVVSIGFVLPRGTPTVWRGPMIGTAVRQLLHDIDWGELDYLIIDLPPGTSDASMSMAQEAPIAGVVIVSTPQEVAIEDATKAVTMFEKLNVPIFGIVENMSYFLCPHCGQRTDIFGHGGARQAAEELGLEFLGELPIDPATRQGADEGRPVVDALPDSPQAQAFMRLAEQVAARCSVLQYAGGGP
ncbi:MAG TPA: Mrp/NBP35 family ATP-binding protein [Dehalococcoidia bacterium]|nr:Mrp/NBP35 family ATP-binding protein [Dehalococcoidia bacterium]